MSQQDQPNPEFDPTKSTAMRKENESDRSPELKAARGEFVATTNALLDGLRQKQAAHATVRMGNLEFPIDTEPHVTERRLGANPLRPKLHMVQRQMVPGIALFGDGKTSPMVLQVVRNTPDGANEIIEVTGTHPFIPTNETDGSPAYNERSNEVVAKASFEVTLTTGDDKAVQSITTYSVKGDGSEQAPRIDGQFGQAARVQGMQEGTMMVHDLAQSLGVELPSTS